MNQESDTPETIRVEIFWDKPGFILIFAPPNTVVRLPPELRTPFDLQAVASAFGLAGITAHVRRTGFDPRLRQVGAKVENDARAQRMQSDQLREVQRQAILRGSASLTIATHAEAVLRKQNVDESLRQLKVELARAKSSAFTTGTFIPRSEFLNLEQSIADAKTESTLLQVKIGELRRKEKQSNIANSASRDRLFVKTAREMYPDLFEKILARIEDELETE